MPRPARSLVVRPIFLAVLANLAGLAAAAGATSYTIATFADDAVANGNCTLREALRASNTDAPVDACPAGGVSDLITLPSGTYPFSGEELLGNGGDLTIQSATLNPFNVSIDLGNLGRFLYLTGGGSYILGGLEIKNGLAPPAEQVGGAIRAFGVALQIYNFRLLSNHAAGEGGAVFFASSLPGRNLSIHNGAFLSNGVTGSGSFATLGGGAHVSVDNGAAADLRDVTFIGNSATDINFSLAGGALSLQSNASGSSASCVRCTFSGNSVSATDIAGANSAQGGAAVATASNGSRTQLVDSRFTGNSASGGPAGFKINALQGSVASGGALLLERLFFDANSGASDPQAHDVVLDVTGPSSNASFYDSQLTFGTSSGLEILTDAVVRLGHLTIADYPAIGLEVTSDISTGQVFVQNSILTFNASDLVLHAGSAPLIQSAVLLGVDPLFLNEPGGDYHLTAASPAVNVGANAAASMRLADLDHHGRIVGGTTDLGCYEFDGLFADNFEVGDAGSWSAVAP